MSEKSFAWRQAGLFRRHKRAVGTPLISLGACSGDNFVVLRAGQAYDARVRGPNRKFWLEAVVQTISSYNAATKFTYEMRESRLKKCAKMIGSLSPGDLLDIGCSTGDWAAHWQSRGWRCSGIDIDREHVALSQGRGVDARHCDLNRDRFPFPDRSFDLIFAGEAIEHLVDTDGFVSELYRCLRAGGHALVTTPNLVSFENRLRSILGMYPIWLNYNLSGSGHVRGYTPRVLKKQLREHGFTIVAHKGNWVPFIPQHFTHDVKWPWLSITGDVFPNLSMDIMVLAQKAS